MPVRQRIQAAEYLQTAYAFYSEYTKRVGTVRELFAEDYPEYYWQIALDASVVYHNGDFYFNGTVTKYGEQIVLFSSKR